MNKTGIGKSKRRTSANRIPCGSRWMAIPWRWLSRKSSRRRNLIAAICLQSRQYIAISNSLDCRQRKVCYYNVMFIQITVQLSSVHTNKIFWYTGQNHYYNINLIHKLACYSKELSFIQPILYKYCFTLLAYPIKFYTNSMIPALLTVRLPASLGHLQVVQFHNRHHLT